MHVSWLLAHALGLCIWKTRPCVVIVTCNNIHGAIDSVVYCNIESLPLHLHATHTEYN